MTTLKNKLLGLFKATLLYAYGFLALILIGFKTVQDGTFLKGSTEKDKLEMQIGIPLRLLSTGYLAMYI